MSPMHNGDRAVLRIGVGIALATLICYGLALPMPHLGCIMAWVVLCRPGEPLALRKGLVGGIMLLAIMVGGVLLVPLLTHYALAAVLLIALLLYLLMQQSMAGKGASAMLLIMAITVIPVAGLIEQTLAISIAQMMGVGILIGTLVNLLSHALFPPQPTAAAAGKAPSRPEQPTRLAMRAVVIVLPVWLLALGNPAFYIPAVMKTVALAQQSTSLNAKHAGKELVLSTLMGALLAFVLWMGLSIWPSLLMLVLMLGLMTLWLARRLVRLVPGRFPPSFWSNAWITALILFGPAIEDSATGKDVWLAAAMRCGLYLLVAGYGWLCIVTLERWWPVGRPAAETQIGE
ncbi:hypothetical protein D3C84_118780 [compost metagenome]